MSFTPHACLGPSSIGYSIVFHAEQHHRQENLDDSQRKEDCNADFMEQIASGDRTRTTAGQVGSADNSNDHAGNQYKVEKTLGTQDRHRTMWWLFFGQVKSVKNKRICREQDTEESNT